MIRVASGAIALALFVLTLVFTPPIDSVGDLGLCLPSPNQWHLLRFPGWLLNTIMIVLAAATMSAANKKYNFIRDPQSVMPVAIILLVACNGIVTATVTTSTLLLLCNALCLFVIISTYEEPNATREFFIIGTLPAIGAMMQYSFLLMIPVYIGGGLLMKSFRIREFIAFIFGLLAPYWIVMGLGIVSPFSFHLPDSLIVINRSVVGEDIFLSLLAIGIMALLGFVLSLYAGVRLFSRNSRLRCIHMTFNLMGYVSVLAVIFDFNNFPAYFGTIALWVAVETATVLDLYGIRRPQAALAVMLSVFLSLYIIAL